MQLLFLTPVRFLHPHAFVMSCVTWTCRRTGAALKRHCHFHPQGCALAAANITRCFIYMPYCHTFCLCRSAATPCFPTTCSRLWLPSSALSVAGVKAPLMHGFHVSSDLDLLQRYGPRGCLHPGVHAAVRAFLLCFHRHLAQPCPCRYTLIKSEASAEAMLPYAWQIFSMCVI